MPNDWDVNGYTYLEQGRAKAWGIDPNGVILNEDIFDIPGRRLAIADSSDSTGPYTSNYESFASGKGLAQTMHFVVSAKTELKASALSHTTGYAGVAESAAGAKQGQHLTSNKAGRATGTMKLQATRTGQFAESPDDTISVSAGSSLISATYHSSSGKWSVYGTLYTATGVETINKQVTGFENLDEDYTFNQGIPKDSSFSIFAKVNNGLPNDDLKVSSAGSLATADIMLNGWVILNETIASDH